jgi:hydroxymethylbilane synthase
MVRDRIAAARGVPPEAIEIRVIRTSGDMTQDRPLADIGGKGLFTKEIEQALLDRSIDLAVHSAKDMQTVLPEGLMLAGCLEREDVHDVFVSRKARTLRELPSGAVLGTVSLRRQALARRMRPDLVTVTLRGNVETRLRRIEEGAADATILALAGLRRLGLEQAGASLLPLDEFPPAIAQGAIAIETRANDDAICALVAAIDHAPTTTAITVERAFLAALDGSCKTPIAGHATMNGSTVSFRGVIVAPDGSSLFEAHRQGDIRDATVLGDDAGRELKRAAGPTFFETW